MDGSAAIRTPWPEPPAPGEALELAEGVLWARLPLPIALDHVNVYALDEGESWTLVDTGTDDPGCRAAWEALLAGPLAGKPVGRILLTHHHPDHVGLAGWLMARSGAELWMPRTGWLLARMLLLEEQDRPTEEALRFWRLNGMDPEVLARRAAQRPFNFADAVHPIPQGYRRLVEGETLRSAGRDWTVRMGEGHAPEHATLWSADGALVIGGDQLLPAISPNLGVHQNEPEADPLAGWLESCDRLAAHATEAQLVLPGHKLPYTGLPLRLSQLARHHHEALARLLGHLETPRTGHDCFPVLFRRPITDGLYGFALGETVAHLNHLLHRGLVSRQEVDGVWHWQRTAP